MPTALDWVILAIGGVILIASIIFSFVNDDLQYNVVILIALALGCAILFFYIGALVEIKGSRVNAKGAAAIFVITVAGTVYAAQVHNDNSYKAKITAYEKEINNLNTKIVLLEKDVSIQSHKLDACDRQKGDLKNYLIDIKSKISAADSPLNEGIHAAELYVRDQNNIQLCRSGSDGAVTHLSTLRILVDGMAVTAANALKIFEQQADSN